MRRLAALLAVSAALAAPLPAPAETLADIRAELSALSAEMVRLRQELSAGGAAAGGLDGVTVLDRVEAMDRALRALTARTEELEFRIGRIVADGTNRIADLEFRLTELEGGDVTALPAPPPLGGAAPAPLAPAAPDDGGALLAQGERAAFDALRAAFDAEDWAEAARLGRDFTQTYNAGPLTPEAYVLRARAEERLGQPTEAARLWLEAFNADPEGPLAAEALVRLGRALGALGQQIEACIMLDEVPFRFPASRWVDEAAAARRDLACQ